MSTHLLECRVSYRRGDRSIRAARTASIEMLARLLRRGLHDPLTTAVEQRTILSTGNIAVWTEAIQLAGEHRPQLLVELTASENDIDPQWVYDYAPAVTQAFVQAAGTSINTVYGDDHRGFGAATIWCRLPGLSGVEMQLHNLVFTKAWGEPLKTGMALSIPGR